MLGKVSSQGRTPARSFKATSAESGISLWESLQGQSVPEQQKLLVEGQSGGEQDDIQPDVQKEAVPTSLSRYSLAPASYMKVKRVEAGISLAEAARDAGAPGLQMLMDGEPREDQWNDGALDNPAARRSKGVGTRLLGAVHARVEPLWNKYGGHHY